jgi:hypothetical protein
MGQVQCVGRRRICIPNSTSIPHFFWLYNVGPFFTFSGADLCIGEITLVLWPSHKRAKQTRKVRRDPRRGGDAQIHDSIAGYSSGHPPPCPHYLRTSSSCPSYLPSSSLPLAGSPKPALSCAGLGHPIHRSPL